MTANEFPRPIKLDALGTAPRDFRFAATPEECAAVARRFDLISIGTLALSAAAHRDGTSVFAEGRVLADVVQACVATGEPIAAHVDAPFSLRFVPESAGEPAEEVELSDADCDTLTYAGSDVDLGEAAAETLLLALDPFPRSPNAEEVLRARGVVEESDIGPFAALKALKDKLAK